MRRFLSAELSSCLPPRGNASSLCEAEDGASFCALIVFGLQGAQRLQQLLKQQALAAPLLDPETALSLFQDIPRERTRTILYSAKKLPTLGFATLYSSLYALHSSCHRPVNLGRRVFNHTRTMRQFMWQQVLARGSFVCLCSSSAFLALYFIVLQHTFIPSSVN